MDPPNSQTSLKNPDPLLFVKEINGVDQKSCDEMTEGFLSLFDLGDALSLDKEYIQTLFAAISPVGNKIDPKFTGTHAVEELCALFENHRLELRPLIDEAYKAKKYKKLRLLSKCSNVSLLDPTLSLHRDISTTTIDIAELIVKFYAPL